MEKMTYKTAVEYVLTMDLPSDVHEKMEALLASLSKKSSGPKKMTPKQIENESIKDHLMKFFFANAEERFTISDLIEQCPAVSDLSVNKVSAIVRQLKESGKVVRVEEKRKAYFSYNKAGETIHITVEDDLASGYESTDLHVEFAVPTR